jgi:hypothetical protein
VDIVGEVNILLTIRPVERVLINSYAFVMKNLHPREKCGLEEF